MTDFTKYSLHPLTLTDAACLLQLPSIIPLNTPKGGAKWEDLEQSDVLV